ncbi:unnamed protein product [Phyllotreta striolata]|uniref:Uncharacterized protein n=1 Tax=Phyllotreta striolata TaxID=444603 RepID=A0A9N9TNH0_PHYSR|nr:unnamed protein product [Phyllotreta striolata]
MRGENLEPGQRAFGSQEVTSQQQVDNDVGDLTSSRTMWAVWALWAGLWAAAAATPQPLHLERDSMRRQVPLPVTVWQKRHQAAAVQAAAVAPDELRDFQHHLDAVNSQMMLRSPRGERQYDVPQIVEISMNIHS